jgi:hypothetical protein
MLSRYSPLFPDAGRQAGRRHEHERDRHEIPHGTERRDGEVPRGEGAGDGPRGAPAVNATRDRADVPDVRHREPNHLRRDHAEEQHRREEQGEGEPENLRDEPVSAKEPGDREHASRGEVQHRRPRREQERHREGQGAVLFPLRETVRKLAAEKVPRGGSREHDADDASPGVQRHADFLGQQPHAHEFERHAAEAREENDEIRPRQAQSA